MFRRNTKMLTKKGTEIVREKLNTNQNMILVYNYVNYDINIKCKTS